MDDDSVGGEPACWVHLLCEECGVVAGEPHREWCSQHHADESEADD